MPWSGGTYSRTKTFANSGSLLASDLNSIQNDLGGNINTIMEKIGVSDSSKVRRGKFVLNTEESTTSTNPAYLPTPDRVSSISLPSNGLIFISYRALWKSSGASVITATIYLNETILNVISTSGQPQAQFCTRVGVNSTIAYEHLMTSHLGLISQSTGSTDASNSVTTGMIFGFSPTGGAEGGYTILEAPAGTYSVGVKYTTSTGTTLFAKERALQVIAMAF